jgi:hypothetical protein
VFIQEIVDIWLWGTGGTILFIRSQRVGFRNQLDLTLVEDRLGVIVFMGNAGGMFLLSERDIERWKVMVINLDEIKEMYLCLVLHPNS